jgi:hypothetical protein
MNLVSNAVETTGDVLFRRLVEKMRVLIVAGISGGVILIGVGSRVAMLILRVTSPDTVRGVESDDGFTIGEVTIGGTYNLLQIGAAFGIIGAAAYMCVAPWLVGPMWFRRLTTGVAAAAVVGSMLIHADGIDFTVLKPTWLAIGLFVALPGLFGTLIGAFVDAVGRPDSWTARGRSLRLVPLICVGCIPLTVVPLAIAAIVLVIWLFANQTGLVRLIRGAPLYAFVVRSVWILIAIAGFIALIGDVKALT